MAEEAASNPALHFVGFDPDWHKASQSYQNAVAVFGLPNFVHRTWDSRAVADIAPQDTVVFAKYHDEAPRVQSWDDSQADIFAHGGPNDFRSK